MKSRLLISAILAATFSFGSPAAVAGSQSGVVTNITIRNDGLIVVYLSGSPSGRPGCATISYWFIKDENSNSGKQQLAMLLSARATGATIVITGTNTCTRWSDGEDIYSVSY